MDNEFEVLEQEAAFEYDPELDTQQHMSEYDEDFLADPGIVDLNKYLFSSAIPNAVGWNRWLLDQGTADHKGHIFVASNSGHLIFVDFTSNPNKLIDNNILIHVLRCPFFLCW